MVCHKGLCQAGSGRSHDPKIYQGSGSFTPALPRVEIERAANKAKIRIFTARPGIVIGKKGAEIEALRRDLESKFRREILIDIQEVRRPELDATLVGENIALQLVRRVAFRRAMKRAVSAALKFGAKGVRVASAGRLGGAEMARREWYREGRVPLHTLRADIDYGTALARTTYGIIGVKVWIFKGESPSLIRRSAGSRCPMVSA